jgi:hypothetical protein
MMDRGVGERLDAFERTVQADNFSHGDWCMKALLDVLMLPRMRSWERCRDQVACLERSVVRGRTEVLTVGPRRCNLFWWASSSATSSSTSPLVRA